MARSKKQFTIPPYLQIGTAILQELDMQLIMNQTQKTTGLGCAGFGTVIGLMLEIARVEHHQISIKYLEIIADKIGSNLTLVKGIIESNTYFETKKINEDEVVILSPKVNELLAQYYVKKKINSENAKIGVAKRKAEQLEKMAEYQNKILSLGDSSQRSLNNYTTTVQPVEQSKVKKSKEEKRKENSNIDKKSIEKKYLGKKISNGEIIKGLNIEDTDVTVIAGEGLYRFKDLEHLEKSVY